jgi:hypothetical protein
MNLGKLLGAGKSFISGGKPAAYRKDKSFYLPQFVSPKNPFAKDAAGNASATQSELPKAEANLMAKPVTSPVAVQMKKTTTLPWMKTRKLPVAATKPGPTRAAAWANKLNPATMFRTIPVTDASGVATVQPELSLEKIKVVHNDLTDAEVEVVPLKSRPPAAETQPAKRSWEVLGERIMKATAL